MAVPELRVACATDDAYAPYCAAMLGGLLVQHPRGLTVHLLHDETLGTQPRERLRRLVEAGGGRWEPLTAPASQRAGLPAMDRIPSIMWLRVLLPDLLPQADRLLYVDVDTLALQPLDGLWRTDLGGNLVGAVDNVLHPNLRGRPAALGLPAGARYFNSGVLLMDLAGMRREGSSRRILEVARTRPGELLWPDQDALNIVLAGRRATLHPRWNCQNSFFYWRRFAVELLGERQLEEALAAPALLHFEGPSWAKPWHFFSDHPHRERWRAAQRATGWSLPPQRSWLRTLANRLPTPAVGLLRAALGYPRPRRGR
jgi:lipopolysaccharide biosynthesis glycosyltransferase